MRKSPKYPVGSLWIIRRDVGSRLVANEVVVVRQTKFRSKSVRGGYGVVVESVLTGNAVPVPIGDLRKPKK